MRSARLFLAAIAPLLEAGSCGEKACPLREELPAPMTEARGRAIAPEISTGLAVSTTEVFGDCRPRPLPDQEAAAAAGECDPTVNPACARARAPLRVLVAPVNLSLELSPECGGDFAVAALERMAKADARASAQGELVVALEPGRYRVHLTRDDRCATCGLERGGEGCIVDVTAGRLAARDLVLDRSTR